MFRRRQFLVVILPVWCTGLLCLCSCENDINKIREISNRYNTKNVQRTTGVDIIYSDSAKVKAKALAPLMLDYNTDNTTNTGKNKPYSVLPKGIKINFYTDSLTLSGTLVADSAILRDNNKIAEMYKNVVVTNAKGETFKSEQLIWDQNKKIFYSDKVVHIKMVTGTVMEGTSFTSDESFNHWKMQQSTGVIHVDSDLGQ